MKWSVALMAVLIAFSSSFAGTYGIHHPTDAVQESGSADESTYIPEMRWLSEEHPLISAEQVEHYAGVGISEGKRAVIMYENGSVSYDYFSSGNDAYDLIIIAPDDWKDSLAPLQQHKESHGIQTMVVGLNEIYGGTYFSVQGRDDAEKIKYFIKNAIEEWGIEYVMLVGSYYRLPMRNAVHIWEDRHRLVTFAIPTDLYYADIYRYEGGTIVFSTWDTNGNGVYGEVYEDGLGENDIIDVYPDVYVGRLACENERIVRNTVEKIIKYENQAYGEEWFKRMILVGGDTFPGWGVVEGEFMNNFVADIMKGFSFYRIQYSQGNLNAVEIEKALEKGAGFLYYSGHGFPYGWATYAIDDENETWVGRYFTPYIAALFNGYRLPVIFLDACLTAKLDFNSSDLREDGVPMPINATFPCFAWSFVRHPYGGAIATVGATRVAFTGVDEEGPHWGAGLLAASFFEAYQETDILGEVFAGAQEAYANNAPGDTFTLQEFILLGDPTLKIGGYA